MPTFAPTTGLPPSVTVPSIDDLARDDDAHVVRGHRDHAQLGGEQPGAADAHAIAPGLEPTDRTTSRRRHRSGVVRVPASPRIAHARIVHARIARHAAAAHDRRTPSLGLRADLGARDRNARAVDDDARDPRARIRQLRARSARDRRAAVAARTTTRGACVVWRCACAASRSATIADRDDRGDCRQDRDASTHARDVSLSRDGAAHCLPISESRTWHRPSRSSKKCWASSATSRREPRHDRDTERVAVRKGSALTRISLVEPHRVHAPARVLDVMTVDGKVDRAGAARAPARAQRRPVRRRVRDRRRSRAAARRALDARSRSQRGARADQARDDVRRRPRRCARRAASAARWALRRQPPARQL